MRLTMGGSGGSKPDKPAARAGLSSRWDAPGTVAGFRTSPPNLVLMEYAAALLRERSNGQSTEAWALDIGGGAGRNAVPLARQGWRVICTDLSLPMLEAARVKYAEEAGSADAPVYLAKTLMAPLPFADGCFDLIIAHGIWNLARSGDEFRAAVAEAARVARPGAGLFLFTFSRSTIPEGDAPVPGETFVFTQFSGGEPQCFLTEDELIRELGALGFVREPGAGPLTEYNRSPAPRFSAQSGPPVIYEGTFTYRP